MYVFVLDKNGIRKTSYVVGVNAHTLEETKQLATQTYSTSTIVIGDDNMLDQFLAGKAYVNGEFVEPPPYVTTKEDKIKTIKAEYEPRFKSLEEAQRRLLLMRKPTTSISTQYIALNDEMVARIKEIK